MQRWMKQGCWLLLAVAAFTPWAIAGDGGELGVQLGATTNDRDVVGESEKDNLSPFLAVRGGIDLNDRLGWFADLLHSRYDVTDFSGDAKEWALRSGVEWNIEGTKPSFGWTIDLGAGWLKIDTPFHDDASRAFLSGGFGIKQMFDSGNSLRVDARYDRALGDDGLAGETYNAIRLSVGYLWGIGRRQGDADGDGVLDRRDKCPDTPHGATVDPRGCPKDSDGDGVLDGLDKCPDTPKGWPVDGNGCPLDSDGDGVPDGKDKCPNTPHGATVDADGCPKDSDGDGVYDGLDRCPGTPKGTPVDASGCPKDSDGDGVTDDKDRCPNTPRGIKVDGAGCPLDSDGDGVTDDKDRCPDTPAGTKVDADGCPLAAPIFQGSSTVFVLEGVNFETDSAKLTKDSIAILDRVVESLKAWSEVRVEVAGHTDSQGSDAYNQKLSERRAATVKQYFVDHGIAADRMTTRGYGESAPLADNNTKQGRAKNRRVELRKL